jgi:transcriptional regulator with XRE-family HTH domain
MQLINIENVKRFMAEKQMSEPNFASAMGITYSYLFRVLRGDRQPGRKFIEGLFRVGCDKGTGLLSHPRPFGV